MAIFSSFLTGRYLRISLLDSCHFQCEYCVDKNAQHSSLSASVALTLNELSLLIKAWSGIQIISATLMDERRELANC
ncbi:hypothetical protein [Gallaecimonas pentaromativorans]|uniref:hypothetical protein n=1 Tax=Gallaecimonas pentaromativorans TaxID=584787 RepID=UPI0011CEA225|nr:hypothetical protein [Gallaecimonas pentaromativorans]